MLAAAGTACDVAARCAVTGREQQQRQGEEFVGIHPPASMEQGCVQVGTACPGGEGARWDLGVVLSTS